MYIFDVNTFLSLMPLTAAIMYCAIYTIRNIQIKRENPIQSVQKHLMQGTGALVSLWVLCF